MTTFHLQSPLMRKLFALNSFLLIFLALITLCLITKRASAQEASIEEITIQLQSSGSTALVSGAPASSASVLRLVTNGKVKIKLKDQNGGDVPNFTLGVDSATTPAVTPDNATKVITATGRGTSKVTITTTSTPPVVQTFNVEVIPESNVRIVFEGTSEDRILGPGKALKIRARVTDANDNDLAGAQLQWDVADDAKRFVEIVPHGKEVTLIEAAGDPGTAIDRPSSFTIIAREVNSGRTNAVNVRTEDVSFKPLSITIEVLPESDVADIFGRRASKEFFVAEVSITNNIRGSDGVGSSILIFSQNLRAAVSYEGKFNGGKRAGAQVKPEIPKDQWIEITPGMDGHPNQSNCTRHPWLRRAYPYDTMVDTVNPREDRDLRSRALLFATSLSTVTSFVTAIAVPPSSSDLPLGLDKFKNLLIPGFERLFSDKRETHRQQILQKVLQPIEEVAFGQQLTKYVFFPKRTFTGVKRGYKTRISEICPESFQIEVALLKNGTKSIFQPSPTAVINVGGTVKDERGTPLGDVDVRLTDISTNTTVRSAKTNSAGAYTLDRVPAGSYRVEFSKPTNYTTQSQNLPNLNASQTLDIAMTRATFRLGGIVKKPGGAGIAGATVRATSGGGDTKTATTDSNGRYEFSSLTAGETYTVKPEMANFTFTQQTHALTADKTNLDFDGTQNTFSISGAVTEEGTGSAIPGVGVVVKKSDGTQVGTATTDNAGRYTITSLPPGVDYIVTFTKANYTFPVPQIQASASGDQTVNVKGTPASFSLSGIVRDSANNPLAGVTVTVTNADGTGTPQTATTNASGVYRISNLRAGKSYTVVMTKTGVTFPTVPSISNVTGDEIRDVKATAGP